MGEPSPAAPASKTDGCSPPVGHTRMHSLQRVHFVNATTSGLVSRTPGGRIRYGDWRLAGPLLCKIAMAATVAPTASSPSFTSGLYTVHFSGVNTDTKVVCPRGQASRQSRHKVHSDGSLAYSLAALIVPVGHMSVQIVQPLHSIPTLRRMMANLLNQPSAPPSGQRYRHQKRAASRSSRITPRKMPAYNKPIPVKDRIEQAAQRVAPNYQRLIRDFPVRLHEQALILIPVTNRSRAGQMLTVKVRRSRVSGSKNSSVRFPSSAATKMTMTKSNFTLRHPSEGARRFFLQPLSGKISRIVPKGHNQPHHARPNMTVRRITISARADPARMVRLAIKCARISRGSNRIGMLTRAAGPPSCRDQANRAIKRNKARYCTVFRNTIQDPVTCPLTIFRLPFLGRVAWVSIYYPAGLMPRSRSPECSGSASRSSPVPCWFQSGYIQCLLVSSRKGRLPGCQPPLHPGWR